MDTAFGVNAPEVTKLMSRKLDREEQKKTYLKRFMSTKDGSLIRIKNELHKQAGDTIKITLRKQLKGRGVVGDATLEGNEESLTTAVQELKINQLRHAVRSEGQMTDQRIPFSIREEALDSLADWWGERWDIWGFNHLAGYTPGNTISSGDADTDPSGPEYNGHNTITAPTRQVFPLAISNDQGLTSPTDHKFSLVLIDKAIERAKVTPTGGVGHLPMRPIMVDGKPHWIVFLHPYQVTDLRITTTSTAAHPILWYDLQRSRIQGGEKDSNPIFSGALGIYNNCIIHESTHVPDGVHSSGGTPVGTVRRAILAGAGALVAGFGQGHDKSSYDWVEELFDYKNKLGVKAGCISGLKKSTYAQSGSNYDFGTIVMSSYAQPH